MAMKVSLPSSEILELETHHWTKISLIAWTTLCEKVLPLYRRFNKNILRSVDMVLIILCPWNLWWLHIFIWGNLHGVEANVLPGDILVRKFEFQ